MERIAILLFLLSGVLSCTPDKGIITQTDAGGAVTQKPFIWHSSISDGTLAYGLYHGYVVAGKGVLSISLRKSPDPKMYGEFYLQLKDVSTGVNIWTWDDLYDKKLDRTLTNSIIIYGGKILLHDRYADYCIDSTTGKTIWKNKRGFFSADGPTNIGNKYFISGIPPASSKLKKIDDSMYMGDLNSGKIEEIVKPEYSNEYPFFNGEETYIGSMYRHNTFLKGDDVMLVIPFDEVGPPAKYNKNRSFFGLYNLTQKKWIYDRAALSLDEDGSAPSLTPIIDGDRVYMTSLNSLGCFDLMTGKRIWQYRLTEIYTGVRDIIMVGSKLIASDHNGGLYCINPANGAVIWYRESSAFGSDLYAQDGVIYGIRGDNLRAHDLQTGKLLWDMPSLDRQVENKLGSIYNGFVTGIPAQNGKKGRIFASTELNVYCFEAIN